MVINQSSSPANPPPPALAQFKLEIHDLLQPNNPRARSLLSFIRRTLLQFHLSTQHQEQEVFNEAYMRGVTRILKTGEPIRHPKAWMRTTSFYIINEWSRNAQRCHLLDDERLEDSLVREQEIELDIQSVLAAFSGLSEKDQRILRLRVMEDLSWKEIQQRLIEMGELPQEEVALRKRGQRAMQKIRENFHNHRPFKSPVL